MRNFTRNVLLTCMVALSAIAFAQGGGTIAPQAITESTSTITLKTVRALFPDQPVAVANELFGGLHSVPSVDSLHGTNDYLDDAELQIGMLVYVEDLNMYYRYKGPTGGGVINAATAPLDAFGVSTVHWESLADQILASITNRVFVGAADTVGVPSATNPLVTGDIYIGLDTTYVWDDVDGEWKTMALNYNDSVRTDRTGFDTPFFGDIAVETDTTWIYAGGVLGPNGDGWMVAADNERDSVFVDAGAARPSSGTVGDIFIQDDGDSTFVWDGSAWQTLSVSKKLTYKVYVDTTAAADGTAPYEWGTAAADMNEYRRQLANLNAGGTNKITGNSSDGIIIYYPAIWGDFTYSVEVSGTKLELTNGISVTTVQSGIADDGVTFSTSEDYKKVTISSRTYPIYVD